MFCLLKSSKNVWYLSLISLIVAHCGNSKAAVFCAERLGSVNLWVWPSFLAGWVCKVSVTLIRFPLITTVPLRALCHHYWLSRSVYEVLWHIWVFHYLYANGWMPQVIIYVGCSRPGHIFQLLNKRFILQKITWHVKVPWRYKSTSDSDFL